MVKRRYLALFLGLALACTAPGCGKKEEVKETESEASGHATVSNVTLTEGKYSDEKLDDTWDENEAVYLNLEDDGISLRAVGESGTDKVTVEGGTATISQAGTYVLSGTLTDGQIVVDVDKDVYVKLVLDGADITCADSAPIYCKSGNLIITLAKDTENTITDGASYVFDGDEEDEPSAAVFAKDDLTFNGAGALCVNGNYNNAIQCKDDLKFVAGTYVICAVDDAIVGKDSVSVRDGDFTIESGDDGIKATNIDDPEKGYVLIENGTFRITAGGDGIQAETLLRVNDGKLDIVAGGGSGEAMMTGDLPGGDFPGGGRMDEGQMPDKGELPEDGQMPEGGDRLKGGRMTRDGDVPGDGQAPEGQELPENGQMPEGEEPPGNGQVPEGQELSENGQAPEEGELPEDGQAPEGEEPPENGRMPEGQEPSENGQVPEGGGAEKRELPEGGTDFPDQAAESNGDADGEEPSMKGLKSYVELVIAGGEFTLDTNDDALHSNQNVSIQDGTFTIQTGDDGVHAERTLTIDGGTIDITQSYEGLEGFDIVINAGDIRVVASDDGINAAGDDDSAANPESDSEDTDGEQEDGASGKDSRMKQGGFAAGEDQGATMTVNGGTVYVNADGDGLDANGDIFINGGAVTVHGPANGGNGTLDYASSCKITGGIFVGAGSTGMAQNPSDDSTQCSVVGTLSQAAEAGTTISVKTADGETIASIVTEKRAQWYAVSAPELKQGESYVVCVGEDEQTIELTGIVTEIR